MDKERSRLLALSVLAAKRAGKILLKYYDSGNFVHGAKGGAISSIFSKADLEAENAVLSTLRPAGIPIVSEETGSRTRIPRKGYAFFADPLDGTINYSMHLPGFTVSIGTALDGVPATGVIYDPLMRELFCAARGEGATLNGKKIRTSRETEPAKSILTFSYGYSRAKQEWVARNFVPFKSKFREFRTPYSCALQMAQVACGRTCGLVMKGYGGIWDVVAGSVIVRESGGELFDFSGRRWILQGDDIVVAGNGRIAREILKTLV